jgi:hypothetical protein
MTKMNGLINAAHAAAKSGVTFKFTVGALAEALAEQVASKLDGEARWLKKMTGCNREVIASVAAIAAFEVYRAFLKEWRRSEAASRCEAEAWLRQQLATLNVEPEGGN